MSTTEWSYAVFGIGLLIAIIFDLGLLSKRSQIISIRQAFFQTLFWVSFGIGFFIFVWFENGQTLALEYISAYLMEWGLSIDNIFVFILIFSYFNIPAIHANRVLLLGILLAIVLRIIFITVGIALIDRFYWILYIFGAFLVYTGFKMFFVDTEKEFDLRDNMVYRLLKRILPLTHQNNSGKFTIMINGKKYYTMLFVVMIMLAATDLVFALDSIPAVFAITQHKMVIYTSNIFAVLGLRSLFFLLRSAVEKFKYLKEGIAIVLIFIGIKMLISYFGIHFHIAVSLLAIVVCLGGSVLFSVYKSNQELKNQIRDN
ncbi:MAG: TerC/Alx family metal homeostasis membrane protein [Bacteroidota bacterium]|nr:TerC/Alx family metal homeostasis membrane protein [Bacteroidota bacterium]